MTGRLPRSLARDVIIWCQWRIRARSPCTLYTAAVLLSRQYVGVAAAGRWGRNSTPMHHNGETRAGLAFKKCYNYTQPAPACRSQKENRGVRQVRLLSSSPERDCPVSAQMRNCISKSTCCMYTYRMRRLHFKIWKNCWRITLSVFNYASNKSHRYIITLIWLIDAQRAKLAACTTSCNYRLLTTDRSTRSFRAKLAIVSLSTLAIIFCVHFTSDDYSAVFYFCGMLIAVLMRSPNEVRCSHSVTFVNAAQSFIHVKIAP